MTKAYSFAALQALALLMTVAACSRPSSQPPVSSGGTAAAPSAAAASLSEPIAPIASENDRKSRLLAHETEMGAGFRSLAARFGFDVARYMAASNSRFDAYMTTSPNGFGTRLRAMSAQEASDFRRAVAEMAAKNGRMLAAYDDYVSACATDPVSRLMTSQTRSRLGDRQANLIRLLRATAEVRREPATDFEQAIVAGSIGRLASTSSACAPAPGAVVASTPGVDPMGSVTGFDPAQTEGEGTGWANVNPLLRRAQDLAGRAMGSAAATLAEAQSALQRRVEAQRRENEELEKAFADEMAALRADLAAESAQRTAEQAEREDQARRLAERRAADEARAQAAYEAFAATAQRVSDQFQFSVEAAHARLHPREIPAFRSRLAELAREDGSRLSAFRSALVEVAVAARDYEAAATSAADSANYGRTLVLMGRAGVASKARLRVLDAHLTLREWLASNGRPGDAQATEAEAAIALTREQLRTQSASRGTDTLIAACGAACRTASRLGSSAYEAVAERARREGLPLLRQAWESVLGEARAANPQN